MTVVTVCVAEYRTLRIDSCRGDLVMTDAVSNWPPVADEWFNGLLPPTAVYVRELHNTEQEEIRDTGQAGTFRYATFETNGQRCLAIHESLPTAYRFARQEGLVALLVH